MTVLGIEKLVPTFARPRGLPPAAPALGDGRADEPVHVALDRRDAGRRARGVPHRAPRQRPHAASCATRSAVRPSTASAAAPASTSAPSTRGPAGTPTAPCTRARSARSSRRSSAGSRTPPRSRSPRASAAPATRSARSRSTSRQCCSTCARRRSKRQRRDASGLAFGLLGRFFARPRSFRFAQAVARLARPFARRGRIRRLPPPLSGWTRSRDLRAAHERDVHGVVEPSVSSAREAVLERVRAAISGTEAVSVDRAYRRDGERAHDAVRGAVLRAGRGLPRRRPPHVGGRVSAQA